jgi:hypothetical protein
MTLRYFVVEGKEDEAYLRLLLPSNLIQDTKIMVAGGYSSALSTVETLLTLTPLPISFFFDTDSCSEEKTIEKKQFIQSYLGNSANLTLVPFEPEIEILFFYKKALLEEIIGKEIDDESWQRGQYQQPKKMLLKLIAQTNHISFLQRKLTPEHIQELQQNPLIQKIIEQHHLLITTHQALPA